MNNALSNRDISDFPLSIGTGLAFRTLFSNRIPPYDSDRIIPKGDVSKYETCWINVSTLFRNLEGATKELQYVPPMEIAYAIAQEMDVIQSLFLNEGKNTCRPIFYFCTYKTLTTRSHPEVRFREAKAPGLKLYKDIHNEVISILLKEYKDFIRVFDSEIKPDLSTRTLVLTSIAYDLLSYTSFKNLELLESHTGMIKSRKDWWSKYYPIGTKDISHFPFLKRLLLVLGDKHLIAQQVMGMRNTIYDVSIKRNWTNMTTDEKVRMNIKLDVHDHAVRQFILNVC